MGEHPDIGTVNTLKMELRVVLVLTLGAATLIAVPAPVAAQVPEAPSDFNGDGFSDLAVGVYREDIGRSVETGAVNVLYGSASGITADEDQLWHQGKNGLQGGRESSDEFGSALEWGDFNNDGFADLAAGARFESVGIPPVQGAGAVNVIYGSAAGLTSTNDQFLHQGLPGVLGSPTYLDAFGNVLSSGDIDGDGFADLVVGVPGEGTGGAIQVFFGSPSGLAVDGNELWSQGSLGILGEPSLDSFGPSTAVGDLNGDGFDDVAFSDPSEKVGSRPGAGAVNVIFGSSSGLTAAGNQMWSQGSPGIFGLTDWFELWGVTLAAGDLNGDGFDDLAIAASRDSEPGLRAAGAVNVIYGSSTGPTEVGNQLWTQDSPGIGEVAEAEDLFGRTLAVGDFNGSGPLDLAIGAPGESIRISGSAERGVVHVLFGASAGLDAVGSQVWAQGMLHVGVSPGGSFGNTQVGLDFDGDHFDDLAVGSPDEPLTRVSSGALDILYGTSTGLSSIGTKFWHQDVPGVLGVVEVVDQWASALASGARRL